MNSDKIITGEKIQNIAEVYLGDSSDFSYNPYIASQPHKHQSLDTLSESYSNPRYVFCYTHRLESLARNIHRFQNPFVLITHNSDENITWKETTKTLLSSPHLLMWYSQNVGIQHEKLRLLPIGMANRQWKHGDIDFFDDFVTPVQKTKHIYFYFNIHTNISKRKICYDQLYNKINTSPPMSPPDYKRHLSEYQFCICPEGNGYDTHRFWEALYLKVIPIVIKNDFITQLQQTPYLSHIPMVVLDSWQDLDPAALDYHELYHDCDLGFDTILREIVHNFPQI